MGMWARAQTKNNLGIDDVEDGHDQRRPTPSPQPQAAVTRGPHISRRTYTRTHARARTDATVGVHGSRVAMDTNTYHFRVGT